MSPPAHPLLPLPGPLPALHQRKPSLIVSTPEGEKASVSTPRSSISSQEKGLDKGREGIDGWMSPQFNPKLATAEGGGASQHLGRRASHHSSGLEREASSSSSKGGGEGGFLTRGKSFKGSNDSSSSSYAGNGGFRKNDSKDSFSSEMSDEIVHLRETSISSTQSSNSRYAVMTEYMAENEVDEGGTGAVKQLPLRHSSNLNPKERKDSHGEVLPSLPQSDTGERRKSLQPSDLTTLATPRRKSSVHKETLKNMAFDEFHSKMPHVLKGALGEGKVVGGEVLAGGVKAEASGMVNADDQAEMLRILEEHSNVGLKAPPVFERARRSSDANPDNKIVQAFKDFKETSTTSEVKLIPHHATSEKGGGSSHHLMKKQLSFLKASESRSRSNSIVDAENSMSYAQTFTIPETSLLHSNTTMLDPLPRSRRPSATKLVGGETLLPPPRKEEFKSSDFKEMCEIPLFKSHRDSIKALSDCGLAIENYQAGETVYKQNEQTTKVFFLIKGICNVQFNAITDLPTLPEATARRPSQIRNTIEMPPILIGSIFPSLPLLNQEGVMEETASSQFKISKKLYKEYYLKTHTLYPCSIIAKSEIRLAVMTVNDFFSIVYEEHLLQIVMSPSIQRYTEADLKKIVAANTSK